MKAASCAYRELMTNTSDRLLAIARPLFPMHLGSDTAEIDRVSAGLIARIIGSTEAAVHLATLDRQADLATVTRSAYEHLVMLAWINGADSEQRLKIWRRWDAEYRLKFDKEVRSLRGGVALSEAVREHMHYLLEGDVPRLPSLPERAKLADKEWADRLRISHEPGEALEICYTMLYRPASSLAHPTTMALSLVTETNDQGTIVDLEPTVDVTVDSTIVPVVMVPGILFGALFVGEEVLGSPHFSEYRPIVDEALSSYQTLADWSADRRPTSFDQMEGDILICNEVIEKYNDVQDPTHRLGLSEALLIKGDKLRALDRPDEAFAAYDEVVERFGLSTEVNLRVQVARALFHKGALLSMLKRPSDAIVAYDDVVERFGSASEPELQRQVARALFNKGSRLGTLKRHGDAIATYSEVVNRFSGASETELRESAEKANWRRAEQAKLLQQLERDAEA